MFSGVFLRFPRPRKRSAARFWAFRRVGNVQRRVLTLSEASGASTDGLCRGREAGEVPGQIRRRPQGPSGYLGRGVLNTPHQTDPTGPNDRITRRADGPNDRTRVGAYCIRPTKRAPRARMDGRRVCSFGPCSPLRCWGLRPCWFVEAGPFGYPARFAGVRRRPPKRLNISTGRSPNN